MIKTPNRNHYVPLIARMTPLWFHRFVNRTRGRASMDTFPTVYLANSPRQIAALAASCGFSIEHIELIEGRPEYLRLSAPLYLLGAAYERIVNTAALLKPLRVLLVVSLVRD